MEGFKADAILFDYEEGDNRFRLMESNKVSYEAQLAQEQMEQELDEEFKANFIESQPEPLIDLTHMN